MTRSRVLALRVSAVALIAAGVLVLVYRGFTYTSETHDAELGPLTIELKEKERVEVPVWVGVVAVGAGTGLLLLGVGASRRNP